MSKHVVSLRLPATMVEDLAQSAADAQLSVAEALEWLLRNSFGNSDLLHALEDCPERPNVKLDARITGATLDSLRVATMQLRTSNSVYIRKLLYHFFVTKRLKYVLSNGRYTLAGRHD
jgi:hypothetical protein